MFMVVAIMIVIVAQLRLLAIRSGSNWGLHPDMAPASAPCGSARSYFRRRRA
jgi:hypothetical protein